MTPLVAGIALTGKAPMYENVYMAGLKQKAAGETARKKELSETEKQIRASLKITSGTYHPTFHERVKDLTSTALAKSLEAMEKDPIRGINSALQIVNDATNVLGVYSENSKKLFEIEKPQYQKDFYAPSSFISAIGQKSFDEVMADQNLAKELEKYKIIVENRSGVPVLTVPAFARRNPAKELIEYQKSVVGQFPVEEGEITSLGGVRQQKLRQSMPDAQLEEIIIGMRQDPTDVAAWFYNHDVDITTDDGVKKAVQIAKYVEDKGIISRPGGGGGRGGFVQDLTVIEEDVEPIRTRFGGDRVITADKAAMFPLTTFMPNYNGAYITGEKAKFSKLSESLSKSYGSMQTQTVQNFPTWKGKDIELPAGTYGDVKLESSVTIMKGMPLPTDVKNGLLEYLDDDKLSDAALKTIFGETDKAKIKAMIVNDDWIVGSGVDAQGNVKEETTFVPANATNLKLLSAQMQGAQKRKIAKKLIDAASNKSILYKATSEAKGAEAPQSTFNLLDIPTA
jgi:hypothetical protein